MDYTIPNFELAVSQFYYTDTKTQAEAHQWLVRAQNSTNAWSFIWQLLQKERSPEVQFFAATTLHLKIMKSWNEVPSTEYDALRKRIIESILFYIDGPKIVLNRLCIALSAFIIQTLPNFWPDAINDLLMMFESGDFLRLPLEKNLWILLDILTVIPEEFETICLLRQEKKIIRLKLTETSTMVSCLVQKIFVEVSENGKFSSDLLCQTVRCVIAWLSFGISSAECEVLAENLIKIVHDSVISSNSDVAELGIDAIGQMLTHFETKNMPGTVTNILKRMICLTDLIVYCSENDKLELRSSLYNLFTDVIEAQVCLVINFLLKEETYDVGIVYFKTLLECTQYPGYYPIDEKSSVRTFGVWYLIQETYSRMGISDQTRLHAVPKLFEALVEALLIKSQHPPLDVTVYTAEAKESFRWYRQDIADTLLYCCHILPNSTILKIIMQHAEKWLKDADNWQVLESSLHALSAVAENIYPGENSDLPEFFNFISKLPLQNLDMTVVTAAIEVPGAYASWLNCHPEYLHIAVPLVITGLSNPLIGGVATISLKDITRECQMKLDNWADFILNASKQTIIENKLRPHDQIRLIYCIGRVLSILPIDLIFVHLEPIIEQIMTSLASLVYQEMNLIVKSSMTFRLRMLGTILDTLNIEQAIKDKIQQEIIDRNELSGEPSPHNVSEPEIDVPPDPEPTFNILKGSLVILDLIVRRCSNEPSIIQEAFSVIKYGLTTLGERALVIIPNIITIVSNSYEKVYTTSVIEIAKHITYIVPPTSSQYTILKTFLTFISNETIKLAYPNSPYERRLENHTDVVTEFFQFLNKLLKKKVGFVNLMEGVNLSDMFKFAIITLILPETAVVKAAASFLSAFVTYSAETEKLNEIVCHHAEQLLDRVIRNIGGESPRINLDCLADIVLAFNKKHHTLETRWLMTLLSRPEYPTAKATDQAKNVFIKFAIKPRVNKHSIQESINEFALVCRGLAESNNQN